MSKQKFSKKRLIGLLRKRLLRYLKFRKERDKSLSKSQRHSKPSFSKNLKIENKKISYARKSEMKCKLCVKDTSN
jgi:hypothetical protein